MLPGSQYGGTAGCAGELWFVIAGTGTLAVPAFLGEAGPPGPAGPQGPPGPAYDDTAVKAELQRHENNFQAIKRDIA